MVPHLVTALKGPLLDLERRILDATPQIERWFRLEWQEHTPPFYCSVDLRNAGYKLAPVDANLYPGGFHHLSQDMLPLAQQAAMAAIEKYCPDARNLLVIPDSPGRAGCSLQNAARLAALMRRTGLDVRFGSLDPAVTMPTRVELSDGQSVLLEPLQRHGRRIGLQDFDPCTIVLNNDLSAGLPDILLDLNEQTLLPPLHAGWYTRRRSNHLAAYNDIAKKFSKSLGIDPWLLNPLFSRCGSVDLHDRTKLDAVVGSVELMLKQIRSKYREYGITEAPFVVVKSDRNDGFGVMPVRDPGELAAALRTSASRSRGAGVPAVRSGGTGSAVHELIVQEGVPTVESMDAGNAEPVVYMIDRYVVGGFYRVNARRGRDENLDVPGAQYVPLPFAASCNMPDNRVPADHAQNRFYAYGVVARLALLAASLELERTDPDQSLYG